MIIVDYKYYLLLYLHFLVQGSNPNPMPGTSSDSIAAPSAPTTSSSGSVFVLSQSLDINTVDFNFSQTVPTVSRAPDHQGERGTHHEEHPVVINQAVVTPAENIIDGRSQENEESVDEEGVEVHQCIGMVNVCLCSLIEN